MKNLEFSRLAASTFDSFQTASQCFFRVPSGLHCRIIVYLRVYNSFQVIDGATGVYRV
jgi:hypothetical protein